MLGKMQVMSQPCNNSHRKINNKKNKKGVHSAAVSFFDLFIFLLSKPDCACKMFYLDKHKYKSIIIYNIGKIILILLKNGHLQE